MSWFRGDRRSLFRNNGRLGDPALPVRPRENSSLELHPSREGQISELPVETSTLCQCCIECRDLLLGSVNFVSPPHAVSNSDVVLLWVGCIQYAVNWRTNTEGSLGCIRLQPQFPVEKRPIVGGATGTDPGDCSRRCPVGPERIDGPGTAGM